MTERNWDRMGSATGAIGVLLAVIGLAVGGAAGRRSPGAARPGWDATSDQIAAFASHQISGLVFVADGVISTSFLLLAVFIVKLLLSLQPRDDASRWLAGAGIAGGVIYLVLDLTRYMLSTARGLSPAHHFSAAEAATLFDLGNALTSFTWGAIAMLMVPTGLAAIRSRVLPLWLGWAALLIGLANLAWAWLPPGGTATQAEFAFLLWIFVTSLLLIWRKSSAEWSAT